MDFKRVLLLVLLTAIVFVSGCVSSTDTQSNSNNKNLQNTSQVICNKPYILVGASCCLDMNNNSICDSDEKTGIDAERTKICNDIANSPDLKYPAKCFPIEDDLSHPESIDVKSDPLCRCIVEVGNGTNTVIDIRASRFIDNKTNQ